MLMGEKISHLGEARKCVAHEKSLKPESEILCNTLGARRLFWVSNVVVCTTVARGRVCGCLTQMRCGCQP